MLTALKNKVQKFWNAGHERTLNIKKNIIYSFLIRGLSVTITYILVPLTIHYINPKQYGIWLTIYSLVAWMNTFDIGLSNGLRNKLANSIALNKPDEANQFISTTYILLLFIALITFGLFVSAGSYFNWNHLLKISDDINYNIWPIIIIMLGIFCIQFILQPVNSILIALHQPFKSSLILLAGQLLTLLFTIVLIQYTQGSLILLVFVAAGSPVVSLLLGSIYLFCSSLKSFVPKFKFIDFKSTKSLLNLGGIFFFIQIGALVLYETDNIIITRTLGPADVTIFNIAYKYFSILIIAFFIIITPYWSAFTDAYTKNDFGWMRTSISKLRKLWLYFSIAAIFFYFFSDIFYQLWIGNKISVPKLLSLSMAIYVLMQNWTIMHAYILNGTGKLKVQLFFVIGTGIFNIPASVFLIHRIGIAGTTIANIIAMLIMNIFLTYQCELIINQKAKGIWNK